MAVRLGRPKRPLRCLLAEETWQINEPTKQKVIFYPIIPGVWAAVCPNRDVIAVLFRFRHIICLARPSLANFLVLIVKFSKTLILWQWRCQCWLP